MTNRRVHVASLASYFESLPDPRDLRNRRHLLIDIVVIAVCALVCGCDGPTAIRRWAANRRDWLKQFLALPKGIPSRDCFRRVIMRLNPEAFQKCFQNWIAEALLVEGEGEGEGEAKAKGEGGPARFIAIDGKTCRGSRDAAKELGALHIVSAWATDAGIALGQVATEEKSNEITAIPILLKQIELNDAIVTIDAMGCQKTIAHDIVERGGDFAIAVKGNQPNLHEAVTEHVLDVLEQNGQDIQRRTLETLDKGHGRVDERSYFVTPIPPDFTPAEEWPSVKAIGCAVRITENADGTGSDDVRYYVLSRNLPVEQFAKAVRGHWGIESMHWVLDVTFGEDDCHTHERTLANNLSWLRRFAITLLKRHPAKDSIKGKMQSCLMNTDFLTEVLTNQVLQSTTQ